jgi:hypothetical protein
MMAPAPQRVLACKCGMQGISETGLPGSAAHCARSNADDRSADKISGRVASSDPVQLVPETVADAGSVSPAAAQVSCGARRARFAASTRHRVRSVAPAISHSR